MGIKSILNKCEHSIDNYHNVFDKKGQVYSFLNPYGYHLMRKNQEIFNELDGLFFDGILLCKFYSIFYGKSIERKSFDMTTVAKDLFMRLNDTGESIFFVGAKENEIIKSIANYKANFPMLNIVGYRNGYFDNMEERDNFISELVSLQPNFVIIGMGAVKQEDFIIELKRKGFEGIGFTCGGFIHQTSEKIDYFPEFINKLHLRSFYRLYKEKETRKRLYNTFVQFPVLFIMDRFSKI
ncbi:WecB/TagA/CpsF family glycosyltransferase [Sphingobacterium siyangense]|uniref:WecB/TagA/CpsF family glycosyltransferase n=1 Tax=Sphingobacterium siyangense TaxID=459529 RepID=UPI003DA66D1B